MYVIIPTFFFFLTWWKLKGQVAWTALWDTVLCCVLHTSRSFCANIKFTQCTQYTYYVAYCKSSKSSMHWVTNTKPKTVLCHKEAFRAVNGSCREVQI